MRESDEYASMLYRASPSLIHKSIEFLSLEHIYLKDAPNNLRSLPKLAHSDLGYYASVNTLCIA